MVDKFSPSHIRQLQVKNIKLKISSKLMTFSSVTGVSQGLKTINGIQTDIYSIIVFVRKKGEFPPEEKIPNSFGGIKTDVVECIFKPLAAISEKDSTTDPDAKRYDPFMGGCSVSSVRFNSAGTLGSMVYDKTTGKNVTLSNWHVYCQNPDWDNPGVDRRISQPGILDGGSAKDTIGSVIKAKLGKISGWIWNDYVDCAIADVQGRTGSQEILSIGNLKGTGRSFIGLLVKKYGRTTRQTVGTIDDDSFVNKVNYPGVGIITFKDQILIRAIDSPFFSQPGDSGSIIVDAIDKLAVGLLFSGGQGSFGGKYTVANPINMVINALNIEIPAH